LSVAAINQPDGRVDRIIIAGDKTAAVRIARNRIATAAALKIGGSVSSGRCTGM